MEKIPRVQFYLPRTVPDALRLKQEFGDTVEFIGGGTDLVLKLRKGAKKPIGLIQLPPHSGELCTVKDGVLSISALATLSKLMQDPTLGAHLPLLKTALGRIGSPQIRNVSTLGGNLVNACPACDSAPPLLVYGASLRLETVNGHRLVPIDRFFAGPGRTEIRDTELLTAVEVPLPDTGPQYVAFHKFGPRGSNVIASANLAVRVVVEQGRIAVIRLAAGSVAPAPVRLRNVENMLTKRSQDELNTPQLKQEVTRLLAKDIMPITDVRGSRWYKSRVIELSLFKTLEELATFQTA